MEEVKNAYKEMMNENTECEICRALSAGVLMCSGLFLLQHRNNFGKVNAFFQSGIGLGLIGLSILRAVNMPPFGMSKFNFERRTIEDKKKVE